MNQSQYVPGVCNIGEAEIAYRKRLGWLLLVMTLILFTVFMYMHLNRFLNALLFFPAAGSALYLLQAYMHFCARFGLQGVFNLSDEINKTDSVSQAKFRAEDQLKAISIILYSLIIGAIVAGILFAISNHIEKNNTKVPESSQTATLESGK